MLISKFFEFFCNLYTLIYIITRTCKLYKYGTINTFREKGVAVNALWPRTVIATAAVKNLLGGDEMIKRSRKPEIMADAAHFILTQPSREFTGNFCIDDEVMERAGVTDLAPYAVDASSELMADFFVEPR